MYLQNHVVLRNKANDIKNTCLYFFYISILFYWNTIVIGIVQNLQVKHIQAKTLSNMETKTGSRSVVIRN